jgi:hypothetical protein
VTENEWEIFFLSFFFLLEKKLNVVWYCVYKLCKFLKTFSNVLLAGF